VSRNCTAKRLDLTMKTLQFQKWDLSSIRNGLAHLGASPAHVKEGELMKSSSLTASTSIFVPHLACNLVAASTVRDISSIKLIDSAS